MKQVGKLCASLLIVALVLAGCRSANNSVNNGGGTKTEVQTLKVNIVGDERVENSSFEVEKGKSGG